MTEPRRRRKTVVVAQLRQTLVNSVPGLELTVGNTNSICVMLNILCYTLF